jgi:hypothetical protein
VVSAQADDRSSQAFPWPEHEGLYRKYRRLLEDAEVTYHRSAATLRNSGREHLARQAEQFAARVRFHLDDPEAAQRLYTMSRDLRYASHPGQLLGKALDRAMSLLAAKRGNVQILDPADGTLKIIAQHGFSAEFLEYFAVIDDDRSACGRAASHRAQTVIPDVRTDPGFAAHRDIAAASGFRAVQSTPLIDHAGRVVGVLSTHYPHPYRPPARDLRLMRHYGQLVASIMTQRLGSSPQLQVGSAPAAEPG